MQAEPRFSRCSFLTTPEPRLLQALSEDLRLPEADQTEDTLRSAVLASGSVLVGIGILMLGNGLQGSLIGVRATLEDFDSAVIGLIMAAFFLGFLTGSVRTPKAVRRVGHIRVFAALAAVASIAILVQDLFVDPFVWVIMRFLTGVCFAGIFVVAESWLNSHSSNRTRGKLLALYMVTMYLGMAGGQFLLNLADAAGSDLFMISSILISVAVVPMLLSNARAPEISKPSSMSLIRLFRDAPFGVVGIFVAGIINGSVFGMGAVYAHDSGMDVGQVAWFMGGLIGGGAILQWPLGRLSDVLDRRVVVIGVSIAAALTALIILFFLPDNGMLLLLGTALFGGLAFALHSLNIAHTNDWLDPADMIDASSAMVLALGVGSVIGPLGVGLLMAQLGPPGFFWFLFVVLVGFVIFGLACRSYYVRRPAPEMTSFVAAPVQGSEVISAALERTYSEQHKQSENPPSADSSQ